LVPFFIGKAAFTGTFDDTGIYGGPNVAVEYTRFSLTYGFSLHNNFFFSAMQAATKMPGCIFAPLVVSSFLKRPSFSSCKSHAAFVVIVHED